MPEDLEKWPTFSSVAVRAEVSLGVSIDEAIRAAIDLAGKVGGEVEFTHNDVTVVLRHTDDPDLVRSAWQVIARQQRLALQKAARQARSGEAGDA